MNFFGRFHPLVVHLPIGILLLAFFFEALSLLRSYRKLRVAVQPSLLLGSVFAILSVLTGLMLSREGGYDDETLSLHRNAGIATALFSIILYFLRKNSWLLIKEKVSGRPVRLFLFIPLILVLSITGHLGGSMTHGEDYLTEYASFSSPEEIDASARILAIADVNEAVLYADVIQPILESKCYSCHSAKKQKGELRMDGIELISKGGKHGAIIETGNADSSELFIRLMLPIEDEHHMPPGEKPQLSSIEFDLIKLWINEGANFNKQVKDFQESKKVNQFIALFIEGAKNTTWIPEESVPPAGEKALEDLRALGALVLPVGAASNYLMVNFVNSRSVSEKDLERLLPIRDQLIWLKLSNVNITDQGMSTLSKLDRLAWLYLDHTPITDNGLPHLTKLSRLKYVNLVGTGISDSGLDHLKELAELKQAYFYNTKVTATGMEKLAQQLPSLRIDTGRYVLPRLVTDTMVYKR